MKKKSKNAPLTRRSFLKKSATGAAAVFTAASMGPFVRTSKAAKLELRWLGWEHYNVKKLTAKFEKQYNCKVSAGFFDGNSEAYNKLRAGTQKHTTSCVEEG
jgi:spermidine/putrescine-binding protein